MSAIGWSSLSAQVSGDTSHAPPRPTADTTNRLTEAAIARLLSEAERLNQHPSSLISYKANLETEFAVLLRNDNGTETVADIEQVASTFRWTRAGYYDQHVIGHRAQQAGLTISMLSVATTGWVQATLYGNRLSLRSRNSRDTTPRKRNVAADGADTVPAVHPLAADRARWYVYSGGDTIATYQVAGRTIPIVHIRVRPRSDLTTQAVLFDGEMDLDASRANLVRLRGHFMRAGPRRGVPGSVAIAVAFIDYEQAEYAESFWLPYRQRIELQVALPFMGERRAVVRIATRVSDVVLNDTMVDSASLLAADSLRRVARRKLTFAAGDSIGRFNKWRFGIGDITQGMHSDDFEDVGPDRWRTSGRPRFDIAASAPSDLVHFNRVEGFYTGLGVRVALRDLAPGVILGAAGGYAWSENTIRGRVTATRTSGPWMVRLRAARSLDITNDFRSPTDSGAGPLFGGPDPYDYVDRRSATIGLARQFGQRDFIARGEVGVADDRYRPASVTKWWAGKGTYRENRYVEQGGYIRSGVALEWHPTVDADLVRPGVGGRLLYERGDGSINWQRSEVRFVARRPMGPIIATSWLEAGGVFGKRIPPQQLFELGEQQNLPGYGDKEFAGTHAAVLRGQVLYLTPWLRQPIRSGRIVIPGVSPGASVGIQSGWAEAPGDAGRDAIARLTPPSDRLDITAPLSRPTDGIRTTLSAGLRFFGGSVFVGTARPIDHRAPWRFLFSTGQQW